LTVFPQNNPVVDDPLVSLGIERAKDIYGGNDTVLIVIENMTDSIIYYSVSMEEKFGDCWVTINNDILKSSRDTLVVKNILVLHRNEKRALNLPVAWILEKIPHPYGLCRFVFEIKEDVFTVSEFISTPSFLIE